MLSEVLLLILAAIAVVIFGVVLALPMLIPALRRLGQHSVMARRIEICIVGLMSFAISLTFLTWLLAEVEFMFGKNVVYDQLWRFPFGAVEQGQKAPIVRELWVRALIPPPLRQLCYTGITACELINDFFRMAPYFGGWSWYLQTVGLAFLSASTSSLLAWLLTRRPPHQPVQIR